MEMIENGMVVGAEREYARMYMETPADNATTTDFDVFAWDTDRIAEVMIHAFGLEKGDLTEEVAKLIFSGLPSEFAAKCVKDWSENDDVKNAYNDYATERYD